MLFAFCGIVILCSLQSSSERCCFVIKKKKQQDTKQYKMGKYRLYIEWNTYEYIPYQLHTHAITYIHDRRLEYSFTYIYT